MKRLAYSKILQWKNAPPSQRKPLIVKGARQVGKTWLIKEFATAEFKKLFYFNFEKDNSLAKIFSEDLDPKKIISKLELIRGEKFESGADLLFFDEVQAVPRALTALKYFCEDAPEIHVIVAGSLLGLELTPASYPVGKVSYLDIHPMTFHEFLLAENNAQLALSYKESIETLKIDSFLHEQYWKRFAQYCGVGGLPEVVDKYYNKNIFTKTIEEIFNSYLADFAKHSGKVNAMHLERVLTNVPEQFLKSIDGSANRFILKDIIPGIKGYNRLVFAFDWLEKAGLIQRIPVVHKGIAPFVPYVKESIFKLFLFDIGVLGHISNLTAKTIEQFEFGTYKGYLAESYVSQALKSQDIKSVCWEEGQSEIEFLVDFHGEAIPIEVKSGDRVKAKSLSSYIKRYMPSKVVIFSRKPLKIFSKEEYGKKVTIYEVPLYLAGEIQSILS